jgi:hypothetical protein
MMQTHAATARGVTHNRNNSPNQDALRVVRLDADTVALAVADGHGSSVHGDIGARLAVEIATLRLAELWRGQQASPRALEACAALLRSDICSSIVHAWRRCVEACLAIEPGRGRMDAGLLKPYGSTLLLALVRPEGAVVAQLGDGGIWRLDGQGVSRATVEDPEMAIGEGTYSLCSPQPERLFTVRLWPRHDDAAATLVVATDGFEKSYPRYGDETGFVAGLHAQLATETAADIERRLGRWLGDMAEKGSGDDTTMVVVYWPDQRPVVDMPPEVLESAEEVGVAEDAQADAPADVTNPEVAPETTAEDSDGAVVADSNESVSANGVGEDETALSALLRQLDDPFAAAETDVAETDSGEDGVALSASVALLDETWMLRAAVGPGLILPPTEPMTSNDGERPESLVHLAFPNPSDDI